MPNFAYVAIDANSGKELRGAVAGATEAAATAELKSRGLFPMQLQAESGDSEGASTKRLGGSGRSGGLALRLTWFEPSLAKTRMQFTRQLATMLQAKMPLLRCLEVLARQQQPGRFRTAVADMVETVRTGGSLSEAMVKHPRIFEPLYLNMVRAGESSGALVVVMLRLSEFLEKSHKVRGKVKSAMTYPLIIMAVAAAVVSALIVFVVPSFESIFANMLKGQSLPVLTQAVLGFSQLVQANIWVTLAVTVAIFWGGRWVLRTPLGSNAWDRSVVRIPFIGDLVLKAAVARFTRTLGTLLSSNVKILDALRITRDTAGNSRVAGAIMAVHDRVKAGEGIASPLAETKVFPELVPSMIAVGEETGELPAMLDRVADSYEDEVDNAVAALTSILEPVMIVLMAVVVGIVVVALFLPLVSMIQNLS